MKTRPCLCLLGAALRALKQLNTLALVSPCLVESGHLQFTWGGVPCMTGLTSTSGLLTISPEGGP